MKEFKLGEGYIHFRDNRVGLHGWGFHFIPLKTPIETRCNCEDVCKCTTFELIVRKTRRKIKK